MLKALHNRETGKGRKYLVICKKCKICVSYDPPAMCVSCYRLVWCSNCPQYKRDEIDIWICTECTEKRRKDYKKIRNERRNIGQFDLSNYFI